MRVGIGSRDRLVEKAKNALRSGHGSLQDIEFFTEVLNGAEEALRINHERDQDADFNRAGYHARSADPEKQRDTAHA